jgi:hypothetical protein
MQMLLRSKALIAFTALVLNAPNLRACAEYFAYGEYIRHTLFFEAQNYGKGALQRFQYDASARWNLTLGPADDQNLQLWKGYFKKSFSDSVLNELIYELDLEAILYAAPQNQALRYLRNRAAKDAEAKAILSYLIFAKKTATLSATAYDDPWHIYNGQTTKRPNHKLIYAALERAKHCKIPFLRARYAYLAIRSIYYTSKNNCYRRIQKINMQFFGTQNQSEIALWALYFENLAAPKPNIADLARIYWSKSEKSNAAYELYKKQGYTNEQLAAHPSAAAMRLVERLDRCLPALKQIARQQINEDQLLFIVQREIAKVEDWVLTPYYTHLAPAIETHEYWQYDENYAQKLQLQRQASDRAYAGQLAAWMQSVQLKAYPQLWSALQSYAAWIGGARTQLQLPTHFNSANEKALIERIYALQMARNQAHVVLMNPAIQRIIKANEANLRFLFAFGRELEFAKESTNAAYFFAKIHRQNPWMAWESRPNGQSIWRNWGAPLGKPISTWGYYAYWIYYLDDAYQTAQLATLLSDMEVPQDENDFELWLKKDARVKINEVYNLVGTHYFRTNNLKAALQTFEKAPEKYWRGAPFDRYLRVNPFYTTFYQEHQQNRADSAWLTKPQMLRKALRLQQAYQRATGDNKARYAFLLGNFYFNTTYRGNAWMLRRYEWSRDQRPTAHPDEREYNNGFLAEGYYLAGSKAAKNKQMQAFLLRMAAKCNPKYRKVLRQKYPEYGEELLSYCEEFYSGYHKHFKYFKR